MGFAERRYRSAEGLSLFFRDYPPTVPQTGLPVVCIHGLTRNSADFEGVAPFAADLGRRVIAVDVRGRGRSERDPSPERYRLDVYARDLVGLLLYLGIPRAVFIGTSMGGLIAMMINDLASGLVGALVLNDVGPVPNPAGLARIAGYVGDTGDFQSWDEASDAARRSNAVAFPNADAAFWRQFAHRTAAACADGKIRFDYDPAIADVFKTPPIVPPPDMTMLFAQLSGLPVLLLRGAISDIVTAEDRDAMRIVLPQLESVDIPDTGHAPTLDEPGARDAIRRFLARVA